MDKEVVGSREGKCVMERLLGDGDGETDVEGAALRSENKIDPRPFILLRLQAKKAQLRPKAPEPRLLFFNNG